MIDPSSLLATLAATALSLVAVVGLLLLLSALRGAGDELGRAALAESAPWMARWIPRLAVSAIFFRSDPQARVTLLEEIDAIVHATFEGRSTAAGRAHGIFQVLLQCASLVRQARRVRSEQCADTSLSVTRVRTHRKAAYDDLLSAEPLLSLMLVERGLNGFPQIRLYDQGYFGGSRHYFATFTGGLVAPTHRRRLQSHCLSGAEYWKENPDQFRALLNCADEEWSSWTQTPSITQLIPIDDDPDVDKRSV